MGRKKILIGKMSLETIY